MNAPTMRERVGEAARFFANLDAALLTTFNFNPDFFEQNVLPTVLGVEAPNPAAARPVVHTRLCEVPVAVFYDPSIQVQPGGVFRYTSCPIAIEGAFFHPKLVILSGVDEAGTSWVYVGVGSANLTLQAWGSNAEGYAATWIHTRQQQPWQALRDFLDWLEQRGHLNIADRQADAIQEIRSRLDEMTDRRRLSDPGDQLWSGTLNARLYFSPQHENGFADFFRSGRTGPFDSLVVHSPYWTDVQARLESFNAKEVALIPALLLSRPQPIVGLSVDEARSLQEGVLYKNVRDVGDRFWHLKLYWSAQGNRRLLALGSCNFTLAGLAGSSGNVESMLVFEVDEDDAGKILPPREAFTGDLPTEPEAEESAPEPVPVRIAVIYDWRKSVYHWYYEQDPIHHNPTLEIEGLPPIPLTAGEGTLSAPGPKRLGRFAVRWSQAGDPRSFSGLVTEINLEFSDKAYGTPLTAGAILDAWRGRHTPVSTGSERDDSGTSDEETEAPKLEADPLAVVNLYEVYRSFRDLAIRLARHAAQSDKAAMRALLVARPDSVFALARLASSHSSAAVVRYLVLKEAKELLREFSLSGEHLRLVKDWTDAARSEISCLLVEDPAIRAGGTDPDRLLNWFDQKLKTAGLKA